MRCCPFSFLELITGWETSCNTYSRLYLSPSNLWHVAVVSQWYHGKSMIHVCAKIVMQLPWACYLLCGRFMLLPVCSLCQPYLVWLLCVVITTLYVLINPLTTEFFPPRQHIFMHSAHTTFVGTPLPQHSLLSGQTWWGPHTWRNPSGNTINDIHDPPHAQQSEVKGGCQPDFRPAFP